MKGLNKMRQFIILLLLGLFTLLSPTPTFAQAPTLATPTAADWTAFDQGAFFLNTLTHGLSCLGSHIPFGGNGCPVNVFTQSTSGTGFLSETRIAYNGEGGGALGTTTQFIALMYNNQPTSGTEYLAQIIREGLQIGDPAYAQVTGSGQSVLSPVQRIWQAARNVAYLGFTIVFVIVGFMIMFRRRLNPQTVVNIQMALPSLIIGLVLVTFSYFIAGLIVDVAFLATNFVGVLFLTQLGNSPGTALTDVGTILNTQNVLTMFSSFTFSGDLFGMAGAAGDSLSGVLYSNFASRAVLGLVGTLAGCLGGASLSVPVGLINPVAGLAALPIGCAAGAGAGAVGGKFIISGIVYIVLLFALIFAMFRILFALIGAYVQIIISTIFGPFYILFGSIPGQGRQITLWWRPLLANALIFPVVFGAFMLVAAILGFNGAPWRMQGAVGQFTQALPLFGGTPLGFVQMLLAYGILLAIPALPDAVRDMLQARPNQIIDQSIQRQTTDATRRAREFITGAPGAISTLTR